MENVGSEAIGPHVLWWSAFRERFKELSFGYQPRTQGLIQLVVQGLSGDLTTYFIELRAKGIDLGVGLRAAARARVRIPEEDLVAMLLSPSYPVRAVWSGDSALLSEFLEILSRDSGPRSVVGIRSKS